MQNAIARSLSDGDGQLAVAPALLALARAAGLSPFEADVLLLAAATSFDGAFAAAFAEIQGDSRRDRPTLQLAMRLFPTAARSIAGADAVLPTRPLRRLCLVGFLTGPIRKRGCFGD